MGRDDSKVYWKGIEERERTPAFEQTLDTEFPEPAPIASMVEAPTDVSRRSFLKAAGFSVGSSLLISCAREPVEMAIPLLVQGENMTPGKAYWYASTCSGCQAGCGILIKNRDGRPIKIEGNPEHPTSQGGLCAVGQATVLGIYDSQRLGQPKENGAVKDWSHVDEAIRQQLSQIQDGVYVLTGTVTSPTTQATITKFLGQFDGAKHVVYDAVSYAAILDAHAQTHNARVLPHYRFDRAEVIVSLDADFLGTWVSPVEFTKGYTQRRTLKGDSPTLSYHVQLEGRMSLTGSNADRRIRLTPIEHNTVLRMVAERLSQRAGTSISQLSKISGTTQVSSTDIDEIAEKLWQARGRSLIVCGMNDVGTQCLVNAINHLLGNYGKTLDIEKPSYQWQGDDRAVQDLVKGMQGGKVKALIIADSNPAYSLPNSQEFIESLQKVPLTISLTHYVDETASVTKYVCPAHHSLESWDDAEVVSGIVGMSQPAIVPLGQTRNLRQCLNTWMGAEQDDLTIVQTLARSDLSSPREGYPVSEFLGSGGARRICTGQTSAHSKCCLSPVGILAAGDIDDCTHWRVCSCSI